MPKRKLFKTESPFLHIREKLSLSLRDLAALTGIHYFKLYELESGYKSEIPEFILDALETSSLIENRDQLIEDYQTFLSARKKELREVCNQ